MSTTDATRVSDSDGNATDRPTIALEPADPPQPDHAARRATPIADPQSFDIHDLPTPLAECGCGDCSDSVDPLYEGTRFDTLPNRYATDECPNPRPVTVERAGKLFRRYMISAVRDDSRPPYPVNRVERRYANIMEADRRMVEHFGDDLTTVLISRRLSPLSAEESRWLTPLTVDARLHEEGAIRAIRRAVNRDLDGRDFEWLRMTATTEGCATPHEHRLIWVDDPEDEIRATDFENVVNLHVDHTTGATREDHPVVDSESDAVSVKTDVEYADVPESVTSVIDHSETGDDTSSAANTCAAQYLGSQLPYWPLNTAVGGNGDARGDDASDDTHGADAAAWQGAAIRWASGRRWLGSSSGIEVQLTD